MHDIQRFGGGGDGGVCAQLEREPQKQAKKLDAFDVLQRATSQRVAPTRPSSDPERGTGSLHQAWARERARVRVWFGVPFWLWARVRAEALAHLMLMLQLRVVRFVLQNLLSSTYPPPLTPLLSLSLSFFLSLLLQC